MPETMIAVTPEGDEQVTLINVFTVDPARQQELFDALDRSSREIFTSVPGFLSANLHVGVEGTRVVNYAQWASAEHYRAALARPDIREHLGEIAAIAASYDPTLVRVASIHHAR